MCDGVGHECSDARFGNSCRFVLGQAHSQDLPIADISILSSLDDIGAITQTRTPLDLGLTIRDRRRKLKLSQNELARKAGVGRQRVVAIKRGKSRAEFSLALRTLAALDLPLTISPGPRRFPSSDETGTADIDAFADAARQNRT